MRTGVRFAMLRRPRQILLTLGLVFSMIVPIAPTASASVPSALPEGTTSRLEEDNPITSGLLFRARVSVKTTALWQRLADLGPIVLDQGDDWAVVLADDEQLESLARLRFEPQASDELGALLAAQGPERAWLQASLQPLVDQGVRLLPLLDGKLASGEAIQSERSTLRAAMSGLTPEQRAGVASSSSVDDDADGLTNSQEQWWCTDPLNFDTDNDGRSDGAEIQALKEWMGNWRSGPPGETPWPSWPFNTITCPDKDHDSIPNQAERWEMGLNMDWESTDHDKFDDGQELFGVTYCPGGDLSCGYGDLPRSADSGYVGASMPSWVKAPGKHPMVAAYPVPEINLTMSSLKVQTVTTVTTDHTIASGTEKSYSTAKTTGTSSGVADMVTWNDWDETSITQPIGRKSPLGDLPPPGITPSLCPQGLEMYGPYVFFGCKVLDVVGKQAIKYCSDENFGNWGLNTCGKNISDQWKRVKNSTNSTWNWLKSKLGPSSPLPCDPSTQSCAMDSLPNPVFCPTNPGNKSGLATQRCVSGTGLQGSSQLQSVSAELRYIGYQDTPASNSGILYQQGQDGQIYSVPVFQIAFPETQPTATNTSGHSWGGARTTTHTEYEENTITNGEAFSSEESWGNATAVDSAHAADLWFTYGVRNEGTEYAREIGNLAFNIYIGDDSNPVYTYFVGPDLGGDGKFHNFMPAEEHTYTAHHIPLTLDQMRDVDLGGPVRIVVEDFTYGADELFYQDAVNASVLLAMEDGMDDGNEGIDTYLISTWDEEKVLDVLARFFPHTTDENDMLIAIWTPEYRSDTPTWCVEPRMVGIGSQRMLWCKHTLSTADWWNVYTSGMGDGSEGFQDTPASPGSVALFRFNRDSDLDGFSDRSEERLGKSPNDPTDFPGPELIAGVHSTRTGNHVVSTLSLLNTGLYDATGVEAVMITPNDTITITNNTVGGSGRVRAQKQVIVGSRILPQSPLPAPWIQAGHAKPAPGGYYAGTADRTYAFTVQCSNPGGCSVGSGTWTIGWSDGAGANGSLNFGSGYASPTLLDVGAFGVKLGMLSGTVANGEGFTVEARTPRDTFQYDILSEPHTPPVVIVAYNDPQGNHRFALPPAAMALGTPSDDLLPFSGQMLPDPGVEIVTTGAFAPGANTTNLEVVNPTDTTLTDAHLFLEFVNISGTVASEVATSVTLPPGPSIVPVAWDTSTFDPPYEPDEDYIVMAFWTDYQGNILDTGARPLSSFQEDPLAEAAAPVVTWNVGTLRWPESFSALSSLLGSSHTPGVAKQSASYRLVGSAGQPAASPALSSATYRLASGYWAAVRSLRAPVFAGAQRTPTYNNDSLERFPLHSFPLGNVGWQTLRLGPGAPPADITVTQVPSQTVQPGQHTALGVRLWTDTLGIGAFERIVPLRSNDPALPEVQLHIVGTVEPSGDVVFVYGFQSEVRPLTKIAHVNSVRSLGDLVRFQHGIGGDTSAPQPLILYAGDGNTELGRGAALQPATPVLAQTSGNTASTDLTLTDSTFVRRDYVVSYGYQAALSGGGGQTTYQVPVPKQNYDTVGVDVLVHNPAQTTLSLALDVGADGSNEWTFTGNVASTGGRVTATGLASAINAYLAGQSGTEVAVPMRLTGNTQGTYFLINLRGINSTNYDLSISGGVSVSNSTPMETDVVHICAMLVNNGLGNVPAAMVSFFSGNPAVDGYVIGHGFVTGLSAQGGTGEACIDWDTTGFAGPLTLHAHADYWNLVAETNENNNIATAQVTVLTRPDLSVEDPLALSDNEPVTGEAIDVTATIRNNGQTNAGNQQVSLYAGNPDAGGALIGTQTVASLAGGGQTPVTFAWTPAQPGVYRLFARADRDDNVNEYDEGNNDEWLDVYVGFAGPLLLDSGGTTGDPAYTSASGYGVVDEGQPDIVETCGGGSAPEDTLRRDNDGRVVYRFDHLLPGHFYHLDVTLRQCDNIPRQESVYVDNGLVVGPITLNDTQARFLSTLLDPALYANRTISVTIESEGVDGALVGEVNLYDIDYRYADAGGGQDPQYPGSQGYGWLDGVSNLTWGSLPYQSARINPAGSQLRYRFDGLQAGKRYVVNLTFYEASGAGRQQRVDIDGQATGLVVNTGDHTVHRERVFVPGPTYGSDGSIVVGIVRTDGGTTGAMVNEISLEELTVRSPDITLSPANIAATQAQGLIGSQPLTVTNIGTANLNWTITEAPVDCAAPGNVAWLSVSPANGTTAAGGNTALTVSLDSRNLSPAIYNAKLCVASNDPDLPLVVVPVQLTVTPATNVPRLSIPVEKPGYPFQTVTMPITFTRNGTNIATTIFSVDYDQSCLQFDPTDSDGDEIPDSVTFSIPAAFGASVTFNAGDTDGELDFFIGDTFLPLSALSDGTPATITFRVICQSPPGNLIVARVGFSTDPRASFGGTSGGSVPGVTSDGSVEIQSAMAGDCNADTRVDAGDISATVLEIFDGDGSDPATAPGGTFPGSPVGCDANEDVTIDAGDISCTVLLIFNGPNACSGALNLEAPGSPGASPVLSLLEPKVDGDRMIVPIGFSPSGHQISTVVFALDYDPAVAGIDPTDADGNGIPDAVTLNLPPEFMAAVMVDGEVGRLQVMIADVSAPLAALPKQIIAQVTWQVKSDVDANTIKIELSESLSSTFGDSLGRSVLGAAR